MENTNNLHAFETLPVMATVDGVQIINICEWLTHANMWEADYVESGKVLMTWCAEHNVTYYADVREDFFLRKGVAKAKAENRTRVIVEDMS